MTFHLAQYYMQNFLFTQSIQRYPMDGIRAMYMKNVLTLTMRFDGFIKLFIRNLILQPQTPRKYIHKIMLPCQQRWESGDEEYFTEYFQILKPKKDDITGKHFSFLNKYF